MVGGVRNGISSAGGFLGLVVNPGKEKDLIWKVKAIACKMQAFEKCSRPWERREQRAVQSPEAGMLAYSGMRVSPSRASPEAKHFTQDVSLSFSPHCSGLVAPVPSCPKRPGQEQTWKG